MINEEVLTINFNVFGVILVFCCRTKSDSIIITSYTHINDYNGGDSIFRTEKKVIVQKNNKFHLNGRTIAKSKVYKLLNEIEKSNDYSSLLAVYGIDTNWVIKNPSELLKMYSGKRKINWNKYQEEYIYKKLTDLNEYHLQLLSYLNNGCCYTMHHSYRSNYQVQIFKKGKLAITVKSRKSVWGYLMPWNSLFQDSIYNYAIEERLKSIIKLDRKIKAPLKDGKLLKYLVNQIIDNHMQALYKLSAYSFEREIENSKLILK